MTTAPRPPSPARAPTAPTVSSASVWGVACGLRRVERCGNTQCERSGARGRGKGERAGGRERDRERQRDRESSDCSGVVRGVFLLSSSSQRPTTFRSPFPETDCRFACFNHGFAIVYEGSVIALRSKYLGECDCSLKGLFTGSIVYGEEMSVQASNALGDTASMHAVAAFNQMMLNIDSEDGQCIFSQNFNAGSLLGCSPDASAHHRPSAPHFHA
eukprot:3932269-Rhodomonas_salina.2